MSSIPPKQFESKTGKSILLRTASSEDAASLIEYCKAVLLPSEFFVTQADEFDLTEEQEREWIEKHLDSPGSLIVLAVADGAVIGLLDFECGPRRRISHRGAFSITLRSEFGSEVQIQEHTCWSPDGQTLLISGGGNDTGNSAKDVFICDIDKDFQAANLRKIVPGRSVNLGEEPCFSPDGKHIAYVTIAEQLWVADTDGKNKSLVLQVAGVYCHQPAWSPDGKWIAFASDRDGNVELYKVRWDGTDLTRLTTYRGFDCRPRWSRDGRWILFTSDRGGNYDLFLIRSDGSDVRQLTTHRSMDDHAAWAPDGHTIAFVSMRDGGFDIYRLTLPTEIRIGPKAKILPRETPQAAAGNLVAHYDFEAVNDMTVRDLAGRSPLKLVGAKLVKNNDRGSLSFDGKNDYAHAGNAAGLRSSGPLTLSLWVWPDELKGNGYLISKHGWNIYVGSDRIPRFETRTAKNNAWDTLIANTPLKLREWSFVTAVFSPKAKKLAIYVNGKLSAERERTDGAIGAVATYPLELGRYNVAQSQQFHGRLDEVRVYRNKAFPAAEVRKEYLKQARTVRGR